MIGDEKLYQVLMDKLSAAEYPVFTLSSTAILNTERKIGGFRKQSFAGGTEFTFSGVRRGARGGLIFKFEPIGGDFAYTHMELEEKTAFQHMPSLERSLIAALEVDTESWIGAKKSFLKNYQKNLEEQERQAAEAIANAEANKYGSNPKWGLF
jgi:hypothetical protein